MVRKIAIVSVFILLLFSCKSGYFLTEGGYRPLHNNFKVDKLKKINNNFIDYSSIYVSKWTSKIDNDTIIGIFRFYKDNKVSRFTYMNNNYTVVGNYLNPKNGYMGYYEFCKDKLLMYFFVRKDIDGFFKSEFNVTRNRNISRDGQVFYRKKIKEKLYQNYKPDW